MVLLPAGLKPRISVPQRSLSTKAVENCVEKRFRAVADGGIPSFHHACLFFELFYQVTETNGEIHCQA